MYRSLLFLCAAFVSTNALAIGELPTVRTEKTVSAFDLYGLPPPPAPKRNTNHESRISVIPAKAGTESRIPNREELLIPNKPSGDLWSNNLAGEPPLRMPSRNEYSILKSDFVLPEESLDEDYGDYFATSSAPVRTAANPRMNAVRPTVERAKNITTTQRSRMDPPPPVQAETKKPSPPSRPTPTTIRSAPKFGPAQKVPAPTIQPVREEIDDGDEFAYAGDVPLTRLSPAQLKRAFKKTFTSQNKHLSTYQIDDGYDDVSFSENSTGFDSSRDLSEQGGVRPLEIKIGFGGTDSALSRDNYNLLTEYAAIVANNPKRAVQISISERGTRTFDGRKLAARRLAIIEQVLKDSGITDRRIIPVLSQRNDDSFVLRVISNDTFQTLSEKKRNIFGDTTSAKTYKSMSW